MPTRAATIKLVRQNIHIVKERYPHLPPTTIASLRRITAAFHLGVSNGEISLVDGRWYITHSGLLRIAQRRGCRSISTQIVSRYCDSERRRWVFKAAVETFRPKKFFVGYGDADPSNVSPLVRGAEMRVAETRAVNRALRKAFAVGLCSVEELG